MNNHPQQSPSYQSYSNEAGQSVLGGLMLENDRWDDIAPMLVSDDFYYAAHRLIFIEISRLVSVGHPIDLITLSESLEKQGKSDEEASSKLTKLLSAVWDVPESAVDFHNLYSESELHKNAAFPTVSGTPAYTKQLFETGWSGGPQGRPIYADLSNYPLFLVSPINHLRLTKAFISCQNLTAAEAPDE